MNNPEMCALSDESVSDAMQTTIIDDKEYYLVTTENELVSIGRSYPLSGNYILDNDITLTDEWQPIGNENEPFTGIFDGNDYTIYNLTVTKRYDNMSFFGACDGAVINKLVVENAHILEDDHINIGPGFAIVGYAKDTEVTGSSINQSRRAPELESVTFKDKTYYMITTKEHLLALANGQLDLDKDYMLQYDIDLSDIEWIPIGTIEEPFTGSFNGNGCEIKGLTMKDPDAKVIGLFGYTDGAKIYNITLRDYDISEAGKNMKDKSISPILVFGTDTQCYDNFAYPKK